MPKKMTTEDFIKKAKKVHGNRYDYSKVDKTGNNREIVIITCKKHGDFRQTPDKHLSGRGCSKCGNEEKGRKLSSNTKDFIKKAKKVHGNKYDYSKVDYKGAVKDVIITCKKHGDFPQTPHDHLSGRGCPKCGIEERSSNTKDFIKKAKKVHGNKYDYSKVDYKGAVKEKVIITCKKHGDFKQTPNNHLSQGSGCPKCGIEERSSNTKDFIKKAKKVHGNKYDYSKVDYKGAVKDVIITCKKHGDFKQTPNNHLYQGNGCSKCGNEEKSRKLSSNTKDFIKKAKKVHGNHYDYSKVDYKGAVKDVIITCKKHGDFKQTPNNHLYHGNGCSKCFSGFNSYGRYSKYPEDKKGILYFVKFVSKSDKKEIFYKIGITISSVNQRFSSYKKDYDITIINQRSTLHPKYCFVLEQEIIRKSIKYKYKPKKVFTGSSECFNKNLLNDSKLLRIFNARKPERYDIFANL